MKRSNLTFLLFLIVLSFNGNCQNSIENENDFYQLILGKDTLVDHVLLNDDYRVQIRYTDIDETNSLNTIAIGEQLYFFPASTVKLIVAAFVLEIVQTKDLKLSDYIVFNQDVNCGNSLFVTNSKKKEVSIGEMLEEMLIVSDNNHYNAFFHFVTPGYMKERLDEMGLSDVKIFRSFTGCNEIEHLKTNSYSVYRNDSLITSFAGSQFDVDEFKSKYTYSEEKRIGAYNMQGKDIFPGPYNFNYNLELPLDDLHAILLRIYQPRLFTESQCFKLNEVSLSYLKKQLEAYPSQLRNNKFKDGNKYPDQLYKYAIIGEGKVLTDSLTLGSKLGLSYGFVTETAYVIDQKHDIEFALSISIYCNKNKTVNDGIYEYESIARPVISRISNMLYLNRLK